MQAEHKWVPVFQREHICLWQTWTWPSAFLELSSTVEKRIRVTLGSALLFLFHHVALINLIWVTGTFLTALVPKFGVKQDYIKCCIFHFFYQPWALSMRIFCTVCSSHLPNTKILVCLESEQTCHSPAAAPFSGEQNPLWPHAFLKEMLSHQ